jgi:sigma-B regulation protein RsbU (phosphoserine phosphatase)
MSILNAQDLETAPCGFLVFNDAGQIKAINETLVKLLGYQRKEDLIENSVETLLTLASRIFYQTHFFPLIKLNGTANEIFFSLKMKNGDSLPVICNATRKEDDGKYTNHCIFLTVSEREKYERELLLAKKEAEEALMANSELIAAKSLLEQNSIELDRKIRALAYINEDMLQFSQAISHDLQEPIRKIAVWSDMMINKDKVIYPANELKELHNIHKQCIRLRTLTVQLQQYISLNLHTEPFTAVDLHAAITGAYKAVLSNTSGLKIDLALQSLPFIEAYADQIDLLFRCLFENFIRLTDRGGTLHLYIDCQMEQSNSYQATKGRYRYIDMVKICIIGMGSGMPPANEFKVLNMKADLRTISAGYGLASCRKIVDNHFGAIESKTDADNDTIVNIWLPLKQHT